MSKKTEENSAKRTIIGKIVGTHGIKGVMLLLPLTDYPDRFFDMKELVLEMPEKPSRTLKIKEITPYVGQNTLFLSVEGITDKEQADKLKTGVITVSDNEKVELPENEYWIDDMIGLKVLESVTGFELGVLSEILSTGSNDVYMIKTLEGIVKPIPATANVIHSVDIAEGTMTITVPEGLWD